MKITKFKKSRRKCDPFSREKTVNEHSNPMVTTYRTVRQWLRVAIRIGLSDVKEDTQDKWKDINQHKEIQT